MAKKTESNETKSGQDQTSTLGDFSNDKIIQSKIDAGIYKGKNIKVVDGVVKMTVYDIDRVTGEFLGENYADESPEEPGVFHIPANSTAMPPPDHKDKFIRVFKFNAWTYADDVAHKDFGMTDEVKGQIIRKQRDELLSRCDYTQLPDFTGDVKTWARYRQALRDITKQKTFPDAVEWPKISE